MKTIKLMKLVYITDANNSNVSENTMLFTNKYASC